MSNAPVLSGSSLSGAPRRIWRWSRTSGTQPRVVLAAKAAFAAAVALFVARHVPGVAGDYPYYAPLGAVVAMQSTVFRGLRSGIQTVVGIVIGVVVAAATIGLGDRGLSAVAIAVGSAVLVSGFRILGEGASWAPTAAMFVLLVGGPNAEGYSIGYVVQVAVGVAIGVVVNLAVFPPLHFWDAERRIDEVNGVLADHLDALAEVLELRPEDRTEDDVRAWDRQQERLDAALTDVRQRVRSAEESRRVNPRGMRRSSRERLARDIVRFRALERAVWYTTDLTALVARSGPVSDRLGRPDPVFADPLAAALRQVACVLRDECPEEEADEALASLEDAIDGSGPTRPSQVSVTASSLVALRGVVESERRATEELSPGTR